MNRIIAAVKQRLENTSSGRFRPLLIALWAVTGVILVWVVIENWSLLRGYFSRAEPVYLAGTLLGYIVTIITSGIGWLAIMNLVAPAVLNRIHLQIYTLTLVARRVPGSLWYVGGRLVLYRNLAVPASLTTFASAVEFVLIVVTGLFLGLVLLPYQGFSETVSLVFLALGLIFLLFSPAIITRLMHRRGLAPAKPIRWHVPLIWVLPYLATWAAGGLITFALIRVFTPIEAVDFVYVLGSWGFAGALGSLTIFLPSTFGVAEISLSILLAQIIPVPLAGVVAISMRILTTLYDFLLAMLIYPFVRNASWGRSLLNEREQSAAE